MKPRFLLLVASVSLGALFGTVARAADVRAGDVRWRDPAEAARAEEVVQVMLTARNEGTLIAPPSVTHGLKDLDLAYRIHRVFAERLRPLVGPAAGFKVAFASAAAQRQFGVAEPAWGTLFLGQRVPAGSTIPASSFRSIFMETEVAFTLGRTIDSRMTPVLRTVDELRPFVRSMHAAFDIGDGRFDPAAGAAGAADQVASGCAAHWFVLGPAVDPAAFDVGTVTLKLEANGRVVRESPASEVMGNPWNALLWLVNSVLNNGGRFEPGDVVLTGTAAPGYTATGDALPGTYIGDCGRLGRVTIEIR